MNQLLAYATRSFNWLEHRIDGRKFKRVVGTLLMLLFLLLLLSVAVGERLTPDGLLPGLLPQNYLAVIGMIFTILLVFEVLDLIVGLARDWWSAIGTQIEILTLILLRDVFKSLAKTQGVIEWETLREHLVDIGAAAAGALVLFVLLGIYYSGEHVADVTDNDSDHAEYIATRKLVSLGLLLVFGVTIVQHLLRAVAGDAPPDLFISFYTFLIFSDVLLVLISLRYSFTYRFAFRNTSHSVATVLILLALIAPPKYGALIGVITGLYAIALTRAFDRYAPVMRQQRIEEEQRDEQISEEIERSSGVEIETRYDDKAM